MIVVDVADTIAGMGIAPVADMAMIAEDAAGMVATAEGMAIAEDMATATIEGVTAIVEDTAIAIEVAAMTVS